MIHRNVGVVRRSDLIEGQHAVLEVVVEHGPELAGESGPAPAFEQASAIP